MFRKKVNLEYEIVQKEYPQIISPAKSSIPEWYKNIPRWKDNKVASAETGIHQSVKMCVPLLESLSSGYMITLPYDLYVENKDGSPFLIWSNAIPQPPGWREQIANENLVPTGHYAFEYLWNLSLSFRVPTGYSMLVTHPLNRHDLPFTTLSGIIDGGFTVSPHGSFPFYIKSGFEGVIEQGTPIMQIIPFKQTPWELKNVEGLGEIGASDGLRSQLKFSGWYKKNFWTRKDYS
jgi:hypothetical protein